MPERSRATTGVNVVCTAIDRRKSFTLSTKDGEVAANEATPGMAATFKFEGRCAD